ncbi:MAG: UbiD family decarboxylase [Candidatus Brocadiaceae bacterium]
MFSIKRCNIQKDLRSFLSALEREKELITFDEEIDWKYETGEKTRNLQASPATSKALLFRNVKDYPGYRILTNGLGSFSRIALALGLEPDTQYKDIVTIFKKRFSNPQEPILVKDSPTNDCITAGSDVNLFNLPVPLWSTVDGGRFLGTWHLNVTKDIDTGIRNIGIYRMMLLNSRQTTVSFSANSHIAAHIRKSEEKGKPLEMAVVIGADESIIMAAAAGLPYGYDEYFIAGGLMEEPVELVPCRSISLEVPARAEIVIEGKILPGKKARDGPFLDYTGMPSVNPEASIFETTCVRQRTNPIFRGAAIGPPGSEDHLVFSILSRINAVDFHGSRRKKIIQNYLLKFKLFKAFQFAGNYRKLMNRNV